ncbi:hypothetical protein QBC33DRAFT_161782 [Phialemonium atrogriseum]|uniref:Uncharacterized protein n=1 Tax=Phialemonium atrogriseum TaxID=1093897 RepID=A0AAJ0C7P7_9PEZI|nr:uncharacterized protein QBC33DRAFT_161782 [Phialemonium atrogriseum]KAK1771684.1 hypothetical protein QBC33DRAFT_161782 [Phialemonium atrogriseum]
MPKYELSLIPGVQAEIDAKFHPEAEYAVLQPPELEQCHETPEIISWSQCLGASQLVGPLKRRHELGDPTMTGEHAGPAPGPVGNPIDFSQDIREEEEIGSSHPQAPPQRATVPFTFLLFPPEIRNIIYDMSLELPDSHTLYRDYNRQIGKYYVRRSMRVEEEFPVYHGRLRTSTNLTPVPGHHEGVPPGPQDPEPGCRPPAAVTPGREPAKMLCQFLGVQTLQSLRFLEVRLALGHGKHGSGWVWSELLVELVAILLRKNVFEKLRFVISMHRLNERHLWFEEGVYLAIIQIADLAKKNLTFWAPGKVEVEVWMVIRDTTYKIDLSNTARLSLGGETRHYPDKYIWPGSSSLFDFL